MADDEDFVRNARPGVQKSNGSKVRKKGKNFFWCACMHNRVEVKCTKNGIIVKDIFSLDIIYFLLCAYQHFRFQVNVDSYYGENSRTKPLEHGWRLKSVPFRNSQFDDIDDWTLIKFVFWLLDNETFEEDIMMRLELITMNFVIECGLYAKDNLASQYNLAKLISKEGRL